MNISLKSGDIQLTKVFNSKLVYLTGSLQKGNALITAIETAITGESLSDLLIQDISQGVLKDFPSYIQLSLHDFKCELSILNSIWKYNLVSSCSLQYIRGIFCNDVCKCRSCLCDSTSSESNGVNIEKLLACTGYYSNKINKADWLRIVNGMNKICGYSAVSVIDNKIKFNWEDVDSKAQDFLKVLFNIWISCVISAGQYTKIVMLSVDSGVSMYLYRFLELIKGMQNIVHIIVATGYSDGKAQLDSLGFSEVDLC